MNAHTDSVLDSGGDTASSVFAACGGRAAVKFPNKLCGRPPQHVPAPCKLSFDLLILKVVSESRATWATSVRILIFLGLSVLDLGLMYAADRRQTRIIA